MEEEENTPVDYSESILYGCYHFLELSKEFPEYTWINYLPKITKLEQIREVLDKYQEEGRKVWVVRETCLSTQLYTASFYDEKPAVSDEELKRLMES